MQIVNANAYNTVHPTAITLSINVVNATCQKSNGKIVILATGGVAPYQYENVGFTTWVNPYFFYLAPGNYTIKVTDALGQVATQNVPIINLYVKPKATVISKTSPSDCTTRDATLTLQGSVGTAPYTYTLDGYNYQTSNVFNTLTAGTYAYAVKDAHGCTSNDLLTNIFPVHINSTCDINAGSGGGGGNCNPLFLNWDISPPSGGTPPYTFSKDGLNYQTSNSFDSIPVGIFTVWVKDAAGLVLLISVSRIDDHYGCTPFSVSTTSIAALCGQNGIINALATEGIPPYQYSLDGVSFQANNQFTGLVPGKYTVTVKDSLGLITAVLVIVPNKCVTVTANTTSSTCGNNNGTITAQASAGTAPYQYSLNGINYAVSNIFTNLAANNYTIYSKDAIGSVGTVNAIVSNIEGPKIILIDTTATGCDNRSGIIKVAAINGTSPLSYSINGTVFQSSSTFTSVAQGSYTVTTKDANGCIDTKQAIITISSTPPIVNLGNDVTLCEGNTLLLDASNLNSTYKWQDNTINSTYLVTKAGKYFVTVSRQGCTTKDSINIDYNLKPKFSLVADNRICMGSTLKLDPQITGVNYLWQDGSTNSTYTVTQPGTYSLTATNSCGSTTNYINIGNGICDLYVPNTFTPNSDTKNDLFKASYGDNVTEFHLQVYNRYGQIVFETRDKNKGWNGTFLGSRQPFGAYAWVIQYNTAVNRTMQKLQGTVLLIY